MAGAIVDGCEAASDAGPACATTVKEPDRKTTPSRTFFNIVLLQYKPSNEIVLARMLHVPSLLRRQNWSGSITRRLATRSWLGGISHKDALLASWAISRQIVHP